MTIPHMEAQASTEKSAPSVSRYARTSIQHAGTNLLEHPKKGAFQPHQASNNDNTEHEASPTSGKRSKKPKAPNSGHSTGKEDKPTQAWHWAERMLGDKLNPYFAEANHTTSSEAVYRWNGSYLQFIGTEEGAGLVTRWLHKSCKQAASLATAKNAWLYGAKMLRTERPMKQPDLNRNIVPCSDVYLEIFPDRTIKALQPSPDFGMTFAMNVAAKTPAGKIHKPKPLPKTSKFYKFLERALPDPEVRALVQEQCGMGLLPKNYQMASWWVGVAGSGKSTLAELCKAMQRQVATVSLDQLGNRFTLEQLMGASLIIVPEVEFGPWAEGPFKSVCGGDSQTVDRKNEKALVGVIFRAKWLIISNTLPFVRDKSNGVWRRLCVVPFEVCIPENERVPEFHNVLLKEEGDLILDWMLEGAARLVERGRFMSEDERPAAIRHVKEEARVDSDSVRAWVTAYGVSTTAVRSDHKRKEDVYAEYVKWCKSAGTVAIDENPFWKNIRAKVTDFNHYAKREGKEQPYFCNVAWRGLEVVSDTPVVMSGTTNWDALEFDAD
jgi:P4 family phage/plasmid primase-like protien